MKRDCLVSPAKERKKIIKSFPGQNIKVPEAGDIVSIPAGEFLSDWLFEDKDVDDPSLKDFDAIAKRISDARPDLENYFECDGRTHRAGPKEGGKERAGDVKLSHDGRK